MAAERERVTVTATSFLETGFEEGEWGRSREEMLAGNEAKGDAGVEEEDDDEEEEGDGEEG